MFVMPSANKIMESSYHIYLGIYIHSCWPCVFAFSGGKRERETVFALCTPCTIYICAGSIASRPGARVHSTNDSCQALCSPFSVEEVVSSARLSTSLSVFSCNLYLSTVVNTSHAVLGKIPDHLLWLWSFLSFYILFIRCTFSSPRRISVISECF